jgi:hypothetical protein
MTAVAGTPADGGRRLRAAALLAVGIVVAIGGGMLVSGCANDGASLAQQACVHVDSSIRLYTEAEHAGSSASARAKVDKATDQLNQALQFAAEANSANPAFNPLMTTLQEIGRTSEANLITALRAQCVAARDPTSQSPVPGGPTSGTVPAGTGTHG